MSITCLPPKLRLALPLLWLAAGGVARAAADAPMPPIRDTSDAIARVHRDTDGMVLSAESRETWRGVEYRVKVLTPQGHVKVINLVGENNRPSGRSTKNPAASAGRQPRE